MSDSPQGIIDKLAAENQDLRHDLESLKNGWLRTGSQLENTRKRIWELRKRIKEAVSACKTMKDRITELQNDRDYTWNDWPPSYEIDDIIERESVT